MTKEEVKLIGWEWEAQCGLDYIFHRGFNGSGWYQLTLYYEDDYIQICRKRVYKPEDVRVMYYGPCPSINDLDYLCKLLKIKG